MANKDNKKASKITTIKITKQTKERVEKLRSYKRETYDELLGKLLDILSICRATPERARLMLISLDQKHQKVDPKVVSSTSKIQISQQSTPNRIAPRQMQPNSHLINKSNLANNQENRKIMSKRPFSHRSQGH